MGFTGLCMFGNEESTVISPRPLKGIQNLAFVTKEYNNCMYEIPIRRGIKKNAFHFGEKKLKNRQ